MIVCDRCKKPARPFAYGDAINEAYDYADLCYECTNEIKELIWRFRKGDKLEAKEVYKASEKSKAGSCILTFVYVVAAAFIICSILMMAGSMTIGTIAFFNGGKL